jgi:glucose-6-phosphate 1-dehydrogenase
VWNRNHINYVEITAAEPLGVGHRAGYYEESGALRDMVANHLLQLLALTAMEAPASLDADVIRDKKSEVWRSIRPMTATEVGAAHGARAICCRKDRRSARARLSPGKGRCSRLPYRDLRGTGVEHRQLALGRCTLLHAYRKMSRPPGHRNHVHFRQAPVSLFPNTDALESNSITLRIQPDEGISLVFGAKQPGVGKQATAVSMDFCYRSAFAGQPPSAYAVLLLDAMRGDPTLFTRRDGVEAQWRLITPIEEAWAAQQDEPLPSYAAGSDGPAAADALLSRKGHRWRLIADNVGMCHI